MGNYIKKLRDFFGNRELEIVIVGLDNAGKSTITSKLTEEEPISKGPTIGLDIKTVKKNNVTIKMWDLGGQGGLNSAVPTRVVQVRRGLWSHHFRG